jgi:hypothetical protein
MKETANLEVKVETESEFWKEFEHTRKRTCACKETSWPAYVVF